MGKFLDDFLKTMPDIQRSSLKEILEVDKGGLTVYEREVVRNQIETLMRRAESESNFSFQNHRQEKKTNSTSHNLNMEEIGFDLRVLFKLLNTIDQYMSNHLNLTNSELQAIQKNIHALRKELDRIKLVLKKGDHISEYIHEDFNVPEWAESDVKQLSSLLKGRSNNLLSLDHIAQTNNEGLVLATNALQDQLTTSYGHVMGHITVNRITQSDSMVSDHGIEQAIDSSLETYWMEHIMTDMPIEGQYAHSLLTGNQYEGIGGAIVEVEVQMDHLIPLSDITIHPFTNYPMEVYAIYAWSNRDFSGERYELLSPEKRRSSTEAMTFQFPTVTVGTVVMVLRQANYTKETFLIRTKDLHNRELWSRLSAHSVQQYTEGEDIDQMNIRNQMTGFSLYQDAMDKYAKELLENTTERDFQKVLDNVRKGLNPTGTQITFDKGIVEGQPETTFREIKKYSYVLGAYNISFNSTAYKESSVYVTKSLPISVNTNRLTLETKESHHKIFDKETHSDSVQSSIEYYITTSKNPKLKDWYPICPLNIQRIESERLTGDFLTEKNSLFRSAVYQVHSLRFKSLSNTQIFLRRNGQLLPKESFSVSTDGLKVGIKEEYFLPGAIYTISYVPDHTSYYLQVSDLQNVEPTQYTSEQGEIGERFRNVPPGHVLTLSNTPFVVREYLLKEDKKNKRVEQKEDIQQAQDLRLPLHVWADDVRLVDVTNYASATFNPEDLKQNNGYTFAVINNKIYLGTPNDRAIYEQVTVDYRYILTNIRLKAILRRNTNDDDSITPVLKSYTLRVETKDLEGQA